MLDPLILRALSKVEKLAIEGFMKSVALPILYDWGQKGIDQIGTGTLISVGSRQFLITARHLFKDGTYDYDPKLLAYPETPEGPTVYTLGKCILCLATDPAVDVAVIELKNKTTINRLKEGWRFLSPRNIGKPGYFGEFLLSGYPSVKLVQRGALLGGTLLSVYSERIATPPTNIVPPATPVDLFFWYDDEAELLDGRTVKTVDLPGTSGASVWSCVPVPKSKLWTPEASLRVVGVQSAYSYPRRKYFRAVNWLAVAVMFEKIDRRLGKIITNALQSKKSAKKTRRAPAKSTEVKKIKRKVVNQKRK